LVVNGNDFKTDSSIEWNGMALATTFVSGHQLKATVPAADLANAAMAQVTVSTPPPTRPVTIVGSASSSMTGSVSGNCVGGTSNVASFAINP
jgi:hypothetical protein